jgi:hypothetical protein
MTNGTTAAMNRGAGLPAQQKSAVRVIDPAMPGESAMTMMTRLGSYLIGLGIFSTVDAERRSELLAQYTVADSRWHAQLRRVEQARAEALTWS